MTKLDQLLFTSAASVHQKFRERLVSMGANVHAVNQFGDMALFFAIDDGMSDEDDLSYVKFLIAQGVDVNAKGWEGRTAVHAAAAKGFVQALKLLVENGADIHAVNDRGQTALHVSKVSCMKFLIEQGLDVNAKDKEGFTPFFFDEQVFKLFIDAGLDIHQFSEQGSLLHLAYNNFEALAFLIGQGVDVNFQDYRGCLPVFSVASDPYGKKDKASLESQEKILMQLLEKTAPEAFAQEASE